MKNVEKITSRENQKIKLARLVREGKVPGKIFIEGKRLADEVLRSDISIELCFFDDTFDDYDLIESLANSASGIAEIPKKLLASIADTEQPQGIIVIAERPITSMASVESRIDATPTPNLIYLKEISNPSNLGAVLRTAEAAGVDGVVISKHSVDAFSPKALRAAMGSSFRLSIWDGADFEDVLSWAEHKGVVTVAADISATKIYTDMNWKRPTLVVFGSEAHGLSESNLERVNEKIRIPMDNGVESLNLAVSSGIILFEAKRQRSFTIGV